MGNFQKYCSQNVGQDFIVLDFLLGGYRARGEVVRGRLISPAHESQSMRETPAKRGRVIRYVFLLITFNMLMLTLLFALLIYIIIF
jgi:hypothetical protein